MLIVKELAFQWPGGPMAKYPDFQVKSGQVMLLLGGSGSGKTTLLHLIGGLLKYQSGSVVVNGTEIGTLPSAQLDRFRGQNIGFIFQKLFLQSSLTVHQNLQMPGWLSSSPSTKEQVDELLERLGLYGEKNNYLHKLSYGQQQRVAIGRALILKPFLILADEPTSALDDVNCRNIMDLMRDLATKSGSAVLIATHDHRLKELSDQTVNL